MELEERNNLRFHNFKNEMIAFTQCWRLHLRRLLVEVMIIVRGHTLELYNEVTKWLGVYLNTGLQFLAPKNLFLEMLLQSENRMRSLRSMNRLTSTIIQKIQV